MQQVRAEVEDLRRENQQQKEDLLETIRENDTHIKLMSFIIDNFVPEDERIKIEDHCTWDDESCDWIVAHQHLAGTLEVLVPVPVLVLVLVVGLSFTSTLLVSPYF